MHPRGERTPPDGRSPASTDKDNISEIVHDLSNKVRKSQDKQDEEAKLVRHSRGRQSARERAVKKEVNTEKRSSSVGAILGRIAGGGCCTASSVVVTDKPPLAKPLPRNEGMAQRPPRSSSKEDLPGKVSRRRTKSEQSQGSSEDDDSLRSGRKDSSDSGRSGRSRHQSSGGGSSSDRDGSTDCSKKDTSDDHGRRDRSADRKRDVSGDRGRRDRSADRKRDNSADHSKRESNSDHNSHKSSSKDAVTTKKKSPFGHRRYVHFLTQTF